MGFSFRNAARRSAAAASAGEQSTPTNSPPEVPVLLHRTLGSGLWQQLYRDLPEPAVPPFAVLLNDPSRPGVDLELYDTVVRGEVIGNQRALLDDGVQRFILIPLLQRMISAHGEEASLIILPNGQVWVTDYSIAYNAAMSATLPEAVVKQSQDSAVRLPKAVRRAITAGAQIADSRDPAVRWFGVVLWLVLSVGILALARFYWELTIVHMAKALAAFEFTSSLSENVRILLSVAVSGFQVVGIVGATMIPTIAIAIGMITIVDLLVHMQYGFQQAQKAASVASEVAAQRGTPQFIAEWGAALPEVLNSFMVTWAPELSLAWMLVCWFQLLRLLPWAWMITLQSMRTGLETSGVQTIEVDGATYEERVVVNPTTGYTSRVVIKRR